MNFDQHIMRQPHSIDVTTHEIGHSPDFLHKRQNPKAGIKWEDVLLDNKWDNNLTFFVNRLKSQLKDSKENPEEKRWPPVDRISEIIHKHLKDFDHANFLVVGDMNATQADNNLKPLLSQT